MGPGAGRWPPKTIPKRKRFVLFFFQKSISGTTVDEQQEKRARRADEIMASVKTRSHSAWYHGDGIIEVVAGNMLLTSSIRFDSWTIASRNIPACSKAVRFPEIP